MCILHIYIIIEHIHINPVPLGNSIDRLSGRISRDLFSNIKGSFILIHTHQVSYFSHCHEQSICQKRILQEKRFILAHGLRKTVPYGRGGVLERFHRGKRSVAWPITSWQTETRELSWNQSLTTFKAQSQQLTSARQAMVLDFQITPSRALGVQARESAGGISHFKQNSMTQKTMIQCRFTRLFLKLKTRGPQCLLMS